MTAPSQQAFNRAREAPFLVWPVSRREFYMSIAVALLPCLAWGMLIFGWHMAGTLVVTVAAAALVHTLLKRFTARGKLTVFSHSILSAMVLVALAPPLLSGWLVALAGALIPIALWLLGGPGKERLHVAVLLIVLLQFLGPGIAHWITPGSAPVGEGILARDRLLMGDIRNQRQASLYRWPLSVAIGGFDAVSAERPEVVALLTFNQMSRLTQSPDIAPPGKPIVDETLRTRGLQVLDLAVSKQLPSAEMLMFGAVPARSGTASLIALAVGGLYLAYRYILRPKSVTLFFISYSLALAILAIWPPYLPGLGFNAWWALWKTFPGELATLLSYAVFNSDVVFAAIIILALPGTEPLTNRGRRVFLIAAGLLGAALARLNLGLPAASIALCVLMPLTASFDHWFAKRSWLNRLRL